MLTNALKTELGFDGFIISDWAAIDQLPGTEADGIAAYKASSYEIEFYSVDLLSVIYFYKMTCGTFSDTQKMVLIK